MLPRVIVAVAAHCILVVQLTLHGNVQLSNAPGALIFFALHKYVSEMEVGFTHPRVTSMLLCCVAKSSRGSLCARSPGLSPALQRCCVAFVLICMQTITNEHQVGIAPLINHSKQYHEKTTQISTAENPLKLVPARVAIVFCPYTFWR